jgi:zinc transport system substrate-binding protein
MIRSIRHRLLAALLCALPGLAPFAADPIVVYAVNYPLAWFAERIGGDEVRVVFPAPADVDPAFWQPDSDTVRDFQRADLILLNGADYAKWVAGVSLPRRRLVTTSAPVAERYLSSGTGVVHTHGPAGGDAHAHTGTAFTLWLDPTLAIAQATAIESALARARPASAETFAAARQALEDDLQALDRDLAAAFQALPPGPLLASHPVYQYLARRYAREIDALLWEPDTTPDASGWHELDRLAASGATWMLWEDEPTDATRAGLDERGIGVVVFRPTGNRPAAGDYLDAMRDNVAALAAAAAKN